MPANDKGAPALQQLTRGYGVDRLVAKGFAMRGSTIDQVRHDIDHAHIAETVSDQIDAAEKAAGLQSMHPPKPDGESDHGLWFAIGAGISTAAIAVALAVT
jgi:hypothetical protein